MANRWGNNGNSETLYFFLAPKSLQMVTAAMKLKDICSLEKSYDQPRQHIAPWRKAMTNLDGILKSSDVPLSRNVHVVKAMVFPVVMYGYESWATKKAEHWRIDAFELWYWRRLLRVPWTAKRYNQSIWKKSVLNIHWKDWCWSWNSNILGTWCKELTHLKRPWCWERLKAGGEEDDRGWDGWHHWWDGYEFD